MAVQQSTCDGHLLKQIAVHSFMDTKIVSKMEKPGSLIQVIEKLSKIVEKGRSKQCSLAGQKRPCVSTCDTKSAIIEQSDSCESTAKKLMDSNHEIKDNISVRQTCFETEGLPQGCNGLDLKTLDFADKPKASMNFSCSLCNFVTPVPSVYYTHIRSHGNVANYTCDHCNFATTISKDFVAHKYLHRKLTRYQCNWCKFNSLTFSQLKEHFEQHGKSGEVVLMCSECCFVSKKQEELEAHMWMHLEDVQIQRKQLLPQHLRPNSLSSMDSKNSKLNIDFDAEPGPRKWYTYDQYGMYRCLICSYACDRQRMLKTHAWKHAGEVDCSYPIFEECEPATSSIPSTGLTAHEDESIIVFSPAKKSESIHCVSSNPLQFCASAPITVMESLDCKATLPDNAVKHSGLTQSKTPTHTVVEIVETAPLILHCEQESTISDSLLSSAQKIINCSSNKAGHVNVIVERVPGAGESVPEKHFLMTPDIEVEKRLISEKSHMIYCEDNSDMYQQATSTAELETSVLRWNPEENNNALKSTEPVAVDENVPPARRRTNSESLRLHSLAAEALVTMPMRAPEFTGASVKSSEPDAGQRNLEVTSSIPPAHSYSADDAGNDLQLDETKSGFSEVPIRMGISMSLLTVIEKLRERTDQNTSDEDILKELQDNAQCQSSSDLSAMGNLVEYIANTERPYRCRLCHYSSGNKGYIKQHLRVHRQRQPYQCPICDHVATDSNNLESHMINHCKTRMYHCKRCNATFYYKSQLRNHEREQHRLSDISSTVETNDENTDFSGEQKSENTQEQIVSPQKLHKCDRCDYTSSTYVGVRNHRRIHNTDKPYRCNSCDFATTNINSLKGHMKRHPQEQQTVQLLEQYKCSLCGYECSHPPSLKSHMWKHASDQNYNYEQVNKAINEAISQSSSVFIQVLIVIIKQHESKSLAKSGDIFLLMRGLRSPKENSQVRKLRKRHYPHQLIFRLTLTNLWQLQKQ
ncbi:zinc finger protein 507 isoform X2 [Narcine bancroftii]|uniref:zinc finger protein 507 isoform X2 n=1 Tax=Narcine bancroftii TaxID=1343680 RepID=UPI003831AAAD